MGGELHEGVVAFGPLTPGRESIMLGRVQVGEISPVHDPRSRFPMCFRLDLPGASSRAWMPARDVDDARRQAIGKINDWLNAAGVTPIGTPDVAKKSGCRSGDASRCEDKKFRLLGNRCIACGDEI